MHVRIKRKNTVLFLNVDPSETILEVKEKIETLLGQPAADQRLKKGGEALDENAKLSDLSIQLDDVLFLLYRSAGAWETVDPALLDGADLAGKKEAKA